MRILASLMFFALSGAFSIWLLVQFQEIAPSQTAGARADLTGAIDFDALFDGISESQISDLHTQITAPPSRISGSPSENDLSAWVEREFQRLNLEVHIQSYPVTVPVTKWCRIADRDGRELAEVTISPFWPNLVRTCTSPPDGIVGRIIDAGKGSLEDLDGKSIEGNIALVTMKPGMAWLDVAKLGAKAILFRTSEDPINYRDKILDFPANLPRFLVLGPADSLIGREVRISARIDWEIREARNVYGVLRPIDYEANEALTLMAHTDSWSVVPELSPGSFDGCGLASLIAIARGLGDQRKGLGRITIFAALSGRYQGGEGMRRLADTLGARKDQFEYRKLLEDRLETARQHTGALEAAMASFDDGGTAWPTVGPENVTPNRDPQRAENVLDSVADRLVDEYITHVQEKAELARIAWSEADKPDNGPLFKAQQSTFRELRRAKAAAGAGLKELNFNFNEIYTAAQIPQRLRRSVAAALQHARDKERYQDAAVKISTLLTGRSSAKDRHGKIKHHYFFHLEPSSTGHQLGYRGDVSLCSEMERARDAIVESWLGSRGQENEPATYENYLANGESVRGAKVGWQRPEIRPGRKVEIDIHRPLFLAGYSMFTFNSNIYPETYQTPLDRTADARGLQQQAQLLCALSAQMASGTEPMSTAGKAAGGIINWFSDYGGDVVTKWSTNSLLPDHGVSNALAVGRDAQGGHHYIQKTRDGFFRFPAVYVNWIIGEAYTIDDKTGRLTGARDIGADGLKFPTLMNGKRGNPPLYRYPESRVTVLLARFRPMDIYRTIGPAGKPLTIDVIDEQFRSTPLKFSQTDAWEQGGTIFTEPGDRFYLRFKNLPVERGSTVRFVEKKGLYTKGFCLNHNSMDLSASESDSFWGPGYLAGSGMDDRILFQERDTAISVNLSNDHRLAGQVRTGLADPVTVTLANRSMALLHQGLDAYDAGKFKQASKQLTAAAAIAERIYPAIRTALYDAVSGILLYLFLLVPFSFFAERLLFGFGDIRSRLAGMFGVFLIVFGIIRFTHPAYQLISSSLIVLVGFVIFILCLMILSFVGGKFADQIRSLRRDGPSGESDTDVSRLGASGAAFNLGISNMRKRRVRTAYTIATLVLISFCLVSFTAPRPQLRDRQIAVGSADFNGMVLRDRSDIDATRLRFSGHADVIARRTEMSKSITHTPAHGPIRSADLAGLVLVQSAEAQVSGLDKTLMPGSRWFQPGESGFCYISDVIADTLGISMDAVEQGQTRVETGGRQLNVYGIFDSDKVDSLRDIDGETFLPEANSLLTATEREQENVKRLAGRSDAQDASVQYAPAAEVVLLPLAPDAGGELTSAVVLFHEQSYGQMRELIGQMLDRSPTFLRFAIDGLAFFGARLRSIGLEGYVDIVVPLLVASCIVFNTMLGNVHERRKEISVYSAVGLSPRHVFYLFLAESLVYAIIGVVGGYLVALGLQWLSQHGGGFLGLTIDYSSRSAIYVSVTLMVAVVLSSFVPSYQAARVASPSEQTRWALPAPIKPGRLKFDLPFTYVGGDILAAVPFMTSWFDMHGDDSSGEFSADKPTVRVNWSPPGQSAGQDPTETANLGPSLTVRSTVWLRPYDLGVSQQVGVSVRPSSEPSIYVVHIEINQLTGSESAWRRTNARFVRLLRRHLLSWRGQSATRKQEMAQTGARILMG